MAAQKRDITTALDGDIDDGANFARRVYAAHAGNSARKVDNSTLSILSQCEDTWLYAQHGFVPADVLNIILRPIVEPFKMWEYRDRTTAQTHSWLHVRHVDGTTSTTKPILFGSINRATYLGSRAEASFVLNDLEDRNVFKGHYISTRNFEVSESVANHPLLAYNPFGLSSRPFLTSVRGNPVYITKECPSSRPSDVIMLRAGSWIELPALRLGVVELKSCAIGQQDNLLVSMAWFSSNEICILDLDSGQWGDVISINSNFCTHVAGCTGDGCAYFFGREISRIDPRARCPVSVVITEDYTSVFMNTLGGPTYTESRTLVSHELVLCGGQSAVFDTRNCGIRAESKFNASRFQDGGEHLFCCVVD